MAGNGYCPFCGSYSATEVRNNRFDSLITGDKVVVEYECNDCGREYQETGW